ncbi:right-handed parallel beta-helix repeat-containing protein [Pseudoduganella buxea]|uniref:Uncharacterized protein n=1 Tax=Pseudoduganella buxea TaxID=1949069 RepID=A0A6I3SUL0_9BURK|nr:right-handed parallel beta-helix repeat-containing protein [Pseudoduganella buxea]MTV52858.1 hypothetical protein [Pseudoduganella buxea]GGC02500.1 hypothetical protein GCM10011572_25540 [Pseudoduganella buxea]
MCRASKPIRVMPLVAALMLAGPAGTVHAVDGVVLITQARALEGGVTPGDEPGFPVTISEPGSYRLASDLRVTVPSAGAVLVASAHVTLDLNGFTIFGMHNAGFGIAYRNDGDNMTVVKNGTIRDVNADGIYLDAFATVSDVVTALNGGSGMVAGPYGLITNCKAIGNRGGGFYVTRSIISNSQAGHNEGRIEPESGIVASESLVLDSRIDGNQVYGLVAGRYTGYRGNYLANNRLGDLRSGQRIPLGPNSCSHVLCR